MSSPQHKSSFLEASAFRLATFYAALLIIAFAATAIIVRFSATAAADHALRERIELESDALAHELDVEGADAVAEAIAARMKRPGAPEYWLADAAGRRMIGDAASMEGPNGWRTITLRGTGAGDGLEGAEELLVLTRSFSNGMRLSVGEDVAESRRAIAATISILVKVGAASVLLVLLAGFFVTRNSLRRLNDISSTLERAGAGDLAARAPNRRQFFLADFERVADGINRMLDRNQALVGGLRRMTRDVAHDLRTPLTHLRQKLERARSLEGDDRDAAIASAEAKASEIVRTFDAILRLADIEAGAARARFKPVDLCDIAATLADAYAPDAEQAGKSLSFKTARPAIVEGDRELLMQAGANLIENALKYAPAGAAISVSTESDPVPVICVSDTGDGIPLDEIARAVEPFYRCDQSRSTGGAGLGLSIVKAIADLHDAALRLEKTNDGFQARVEFHPR